VTVFTDGACLGNPGPGGWGWVVPGGRWANGAEAVTTNQRMELTAVLEALRVVGPPIEVISDSTYVVKCFDERWWVGWLNRGWRNSSKKPVANRDLWEPLVDLYRSAPDEVSFYWVKGHAGNKWNDIADRLATKAARSQSGGSGDSLSGVDLDDFGPVSGLAAAGDSSDSDDLNLFGSEPPADELKLF